MGTVLFGQETEYYVSVIGKEGKQVIKEEVIDLFFNMAKRMPYLKGPHTFGVFLVGRYLYLDCGEHIESATFECTNPWDLVNNKLATEAIIAQLAEKVRKENPDIQEVLLSKANVDYSGSCTTWGEHESFLVHNDLNRFPAQLIPHLVSRVIYTGAGGWHSSSPGLDFMVSPRARFFDREISKETTRDRGIFNTRNEPLAGSQHQYRRLHVICGEGLYCHKASLLKAGVTALVVRLIDLGARPCTGIQLVSPLGALKSFSRDTRCRAGVKTASGGTVTAVDIQRHYYAHVMDHISEMPDWAPEICEIWAETLEALETDPRKLAGVLDWPTKLEIYSQYIESRGFSRDEIQELNNCLNVMTGIPDPPSRINSRTRILQASAIRSSGLMYPNTPKKRGLDQSRLKTFLRLRDELFEIDIRFGQIGGKGIFSSLDRQGMLRHHVDGINDETVEHAKGNPPEGSRAALRGECIKRLSVDPKRYRCHWTHIEDLYTRKILKMFDPFSEGERWETPVTTRDGGVF
jgi:proteasome accessory factor A